MQVVLAQCETAEHPAFMLVLHHGLYRACLAHGWHLYTGGLLSQGMGPRFYVQREAEIPDGAMFVPENTRVSSWLIVTL